MGSKYERGAMERAIALCGRHADPDGSVPTRVMKLVAHQVGVHPRTVGRWWSTRGVGRPVRPQLDDLDVAAVMDNNGNFKAAWRQRRSEGLPLSYAQFMKRADNLPIAVRMGLQEGAQAVKNYTVQSRYEAAARMDLGHFDHTEMDIEVVYDGKPHRPFISILLDDKTRMVVASVMTLGHGLRGAPTTECIVAMLARAAEGFTRLEDADPRGAVRYGGLFKAVMFDNALEHYADAITNGYARLGTLAFPTHPATPEVNGKVEAFMRTLTREFLNDKYGFIGGFTDRYGKSHARHSEGMLPFDAFAGLWQEFVEDYNFHRPHSSLPGRVTPGEAFASDPAAIEFLHSDVARQYFIGGDKPRKLTKNGFSFDGANYAAPFLNDYWTKTSEHIRIRFLPNDRSFVDVYSDVDGSYLGRAVPQAEQSKEAAAKMRRYRETKMRTLTVVHKESAQRARDRSYAEAERFAIEHGREPGLSEESPAPKARSLFAARINRGQR